MFSDGCHEVLYKDVIYGSNITTIKEKNYKNKNMEHWKDIKISKVSGGYVIILGRMSDCVSLFPDTLFLDSMLSIKISTSNMGFSPTSCYVFLACTSLQSHHISEAKIWG